jgi:hypothetical protein
LQKLRSLTVVFNHRHLQLICKETLFKSLGAKSKGAAAAMNVKVIKIVNDESGISVVLLHGESEAGATSNLGHLQSLDLSEPFRDSLALHLPWY